MPDPRSGTYPRSPLDLDLHTMRRLGYRVTDMVAEHLSTLRTQRVLDTLPRRATERLIPAPPGPRRRHRRAPRGSARTRVRARGAGAAPGVRRVRPELPDVPGRVRRLA